MAILVPPKAESAHWYSPAGEPVHTRPAAKGGVRPTTLADARKLGLFPSVTTILKVLDKPGLEKWKITQVLLAMSKTKQAKDEATEVYFDRVVNEAFNQVDQASDAGSVLHQAVLAAFQGRPIEQRFRIYVDPIMAFMEQAQIVPVITEQILVNHEHGFAGTMDLAGVRSGITKIVLDWKTRRTKPGRPIVSYEIQPMQIAAYGATYWAADWPQVIGGNVYISSTEPGRIEMIPYDGPRLQQEWACFLACNTIWRHLNGFDPRTAGSAIAGLQTPFAAEKWNNVVIQEAIPGIEVLEELRAQTGEGKKHSISITKPAGAPDAPKAVPDPATEKEAVPKPKPAPKAPVFHPNAKPLSQRKSIQALAGKPPKPRPVIDGRKPTLPIMTFGEFEGQEIHNVPKPKLERILKFCGPTLKKHPKTAYAIKRVLGLTT